MTVLITATLDEHEFTLHLGPDAVAGDGWLSVPDGDVVVTTVERAHEENAPEAYLDRMGNTTGLVIGKRFGSGPTASVRVGMDALERTGSSDEKHCSMKLKFASTHLSGMHTCGHDDHTTIGLGITRALDDNGGFDGTFWLFFQPTEKGDRDGRPMSETDLLADTDCFLVLRLGLSNLTGTVIATYENPSPNAKLDVAFEGVPNHVGNASNGGRNAFHAATTTVQNLYGTPHHTDGTTRINIGKFESPNPQNIIAEETRLRVEVRGRTVDLNKYILDKARRTLDYATGMHNVSIETGLCGRATTFTANDETIEAVLAPAADPDDATETVPRPDTSGGEDTFYPVRHTQEHGGKVIYVGIGASNELDHHTSRSNIDGDALDIGVDVVCQMIRAL